MQQRINIIKEMLLGQPNDCFLLHAQGLELLKLNEIEQAIESFIKVLQGNVNYVGTYYHLAHAYLKLNNEEQANSVFEKGMIIAKQQNNNHAYGELFSAWEALQDF